jgi:large subunit ribosomal protein L25
MARQLKLKAVPRTNRGKQPVKRMRAQGMIPAILYGRHTKPEAIGVVAHEFKTLMLATRGQNVLVDLEIDQDGQPRNRLALIQEVQHHPVADTVLHVDFRELSAKEKFRTSVQVRAIGEPVGVKTAGGIFESIMHNLRIECLPQDMPDVIEVNVEALEIGKSIHVGDITPPPGVTLLDEKDQTIFLVSAPITEEEETAAAATGELAEPEVIGAKKEEGEEGAEGEGKPKGETAKAGEAKPGAKSAETKAGAKGAEAKSDAKGGETKSASKPETKK